MSDFQPRKTPFHRAFLAAGLALVVVMLTAVSFFNAKNLTEKPVALPSSLLFQLRQDDGSAVFSALVFPDGGDWQQLPSDLTLADTTVSLAARGLDVRRTGQLLADEAQLEPVETWQLDRLGFAALLDSIGGIYLTPARQVTIEQVDGTLLTIGAGETRYLTGSLASDYVVAGGPDVAGERFAEVWHLLMQSVDGAALPVLTDSLGSTSRSTMESTQLFAVIEALQQREFARPIAIEVLQSQVVVTDAGVVRVLTTEARDQLIAAGLIVSTES